ncbi:DUF3307 domain-containing protein [Pseudoprimorskyibacter insulae]|uniref:DUF3307 domain-containing protein n=1 Tax=Pseudoprimorskyibacter insulae TaxID=1695997 RepID=A0A2R8AWP6_9RHOB|nr:DUF3307 domain-containing protein [Pseudoprimorskyibacter insulae]SPF80465.1 hypothetical protein PRI8871_02275 [Pseudoprimorskyibacter insulae]
MIETFAALLVAHVIGDFVLQTDWIAANKRRPQVLVLHVALHLALLLALFGQVHSPYLYALAAAHLAIDAIKLALPDRLWAFLADQAAHVATLAALAILQPDLWGTAPITAHLPQIAHKALTTAVTLAGLVVAIRAGGFAISRLLAPYSGHWTRNRVLSGGLREAGALIGQLERGLVFVLILVGHPTGVAFLIAAKSVLRFGESRNDRRMAEYVLIGTLASVGWAMLSAYGTVWLLKQLTSA